MAISLLCHSWFDGLTGGLPLSSSIGIDVELLNARRKLFNRGLAIESRGIERAMSKQGGQANQITGILCQIITSKGVPQRMGAGLLWHQGTCRFHQVSDHLPHGRGRERSPLLTLEDREKQF